MKKSVLKVLTLLIGAASLNAFEWGGKFSNSTNFSGASDNLKLTQADGISFWTKAPFTKDNRSYFMGEVSYNFKYDGTDSAIREYSNIIDLSMLEFHFDVPVSNNSSFVLRAGRFPIVDGTRSIFTQASDGLYISYQNSGFDFSVYGGYTGLLNCKNTEMIKIAEYGIPSEYVEKDNDFYAFAPKYIPFSVNFRIPFLAQNFVLQGWGFADLNNDNCNRYYATAGFNGYLSKYFGYNVTTTFGSKNFETISNLSKADLYAYAGDLLIGLNAAYASGENGKFSTFMGVTKESPVYAKSAAEYMGMFKGGILLNWLIKNTVNLSGSFDLVMNCADEDFKYRGIQYRAGVDWNIFSDLRLGAAFKQFIGDDSADDKISIDLTLAFAF